MDDPGPRYFGEVRVELQRSTVEPYDRSKTGSEGAITDSIERLAVAAPRVRRRGRPRRRLNPSHLPGVDALQCFGLLPQESRQFPQDHPRAPFVRLALTPISVPPFGG